MGDSHQARWESWASEFGDGGRRPTRPELQAVARRLLLDGHCPTSISLSDVNLGCTGVAALVAALRGSTTAASSLRILRLQNTRMGARGARAIAEALRDGALNALRDLDIADNPVGLESLSDIAAAAEQQQPATHRRGAGGARPAAETPWGAPPPPREARIVVESPRAAERTRPASPASSPGSRSTMDGSAPARAVEDGGRGEQVPPALYAPGPSSPTPEEPRRVPGSASTLSAQGRVASMTSSLPQPATPPGYWLARLGRSDNEAIRARAQAGAGVPARQHVDADIHDLLERVAVQTSPSSDGAPNE